MFVIQIRCVKCVQAQSQIDPVTLCLLLHYSADPRYVKKPFEPLQRSEACHNSIQS